MGVLSHFLNPFNAILPSRIIKRKKKDAIFILPEVAVKYKGKTKLRSMSDSYPIVREILLDMPEKDTCPEAIEWFGKVLDHFTQHIIYEKEFERVISFLPPGSSFKYKLAFHLNIWATFVISCCCFMFDDIVDGEEMRRGRPCWHKVNNTGIEALNDAQTLYILSYKLLDSVVYDPNTYFKMLTMVNESTYLGTLGQCMDLLSNPGAVRNSGNLINMMPSSGEKEKMDLSNYTLERWETIARYKAGLILGGLAVSFVTFVVDFKSDEEEKMIIQEFRSKIANWGILIQMRDDYQDVYGNIDKTGKLGTDIQECKCSWLIARALEMANEDQKKALQENYGVKSKESIQKVLEIFKEIDIEKEYNRVLEVTHEKNKKAIKQFGEKYKKIPTNVIESLLEELQSFLSLGNPFIRN